MTHPHPVGLAKKQDTGSEGVVGKQRQVEAHVQQGPSYGGVVVVGGVCVQRWSMEIDWPLDGRGPCRELHGSCQIYPMTGEFWASVAIQLPDVSMREKKSCKAKPRLTRPLFMVAQPSPDFGNGHLGLGRWILPNPYTR
jgi:hypothetical protein